MTKSTSTKSTSTDQTGLQQSAEAAIVLDKAEEDLAGQQARDRGLTGEDAQTFLTARWVERSMPFLRAVSDATRLKIIKLLADRQPLEVGELARQLKVRTSTMSQHLAQLREARIVIMEKQGVRTRCFVNRKYVVWRLGQIAERLGD